MPELRKVRDTGREIRFAHPHLGGWIMVLLGAGGIWLAQVRMPQDDRWIALLVAGIFMLLGLWAALYRYDLTLDTARRRLRIRKGLIVSLDTTEEPLDVVKAVILKKELEGRGASERVDEWEVELEIEGRARPIEVFESKSEEKARAEAESLVRRLGVPLKERTGR